MNDSKKLTDMILRHINITRVAIVSLSTLFACDLQTVPESDLTEAIFWQTDGDFRQATNNIYRLISDPEGLANYTKEPYPIIADVMSDNAVLRSFSTISNGSYLPASDFGPWKDNYAVIRVANNVIEKANAVTFTTSSMPRYKAEAKFLRAFAYHDLVRRYGDVPLILKALDTDDDELYASRTEAEVVIDTIYSDLDYAAANLPEASDLALATQYGMATRGAALALKSRVALRRGTWSKFHGVGSPQKHLQIAKDAALAVIQSGEYQLFNPSGTDSYRQLFKQAGEGPANKEAIWVWLYGPESADTKVRTTNYSSLVTQGNYSITRSLVDAYLCTDGLPIDKSPLYQGQQNATSEFVDRDPRLNGTVIKKDDTYNFGTPYVPGLVAPTGYHITKYYDVNVAAKNLISTVDLIIIRYAEVLLNYAEATYELSDAISDADLDLSINLLRDRVGLPHLTNAFVGANALNMRDEIRRERRVELAMEGFRYDDLLRWKTAETELPKAALGVKLFPAEYPGVDPAAVNLTADGFVIVEPASKRSFDPAKHYLWPVPVSQIALNPNLEQNPNWASN
jgi:starch-binding outer membrane protein, SusD/RagB family